VNILVDPTTLNCLQPVEPATGAAGLMTVTWYCLLAGIHGKVLQVWDTERHHGRAAWILREFLQLRVRTILNPCADLMLT
jgi:hypothetical protein